MSRPTVRLPRPKDHNTIRRVPGALELYNAAVGAQQAGRVEEAIAGYRRAIALEPGLGAAHGNLGILLMNRGDLAEAVACFGKALDSDPNDAGVLSNLGLARMNQGKLPEAIQCYKRALDLRPDFAEACNNLGSVLDKIGKCDEALVCYRRAVQLSPRNIAFYNNIGVIYKKQHKYREAQAALRHALEIAPHYGDARSNLAGVLREQGDVEGALDVLRKAVSHTPQAGYHAALLFTLNYSPTATAQEISAAHKEWGKLYAPPELAQRSHPNDPDPGRTLRVGYVSPDFRDHSVSFFLEPILAAHDPAAVMLFAYAEVMKPDSATEGLKKHFGCWRSTVGLSDREMAELILKDRIDILVDLAGHTGNNRLTALARKPAPVQVTYLGYPNTTGMKTIDYRLTDGIADSPEQQALHTEELVRLPHGFLCYRPPDHAPAVVASPATSRGYVTFGSFNTLHKVNGPTVTLWAKVLNAIPGSRLLLKASSFADPEVRDKYLDLFAGHGVEKGRVQVISWEQARENHFMLYGEVDIALDPFPYNGTTTTCEAAWMGVPTVTLQGGRHVSRVGASLLSRLGLQECLATSEEEYVAKAVALAGNVDHLAELRASLRPRMAASPLCDAASFARALEAAYRAMWQRWCARQQGKADLAPMDASLSRLLAVSPVPAGSSGNPVQPKTKEAKIQSMKATESGSQAEQPRAVAAADYPSVITRTAEAAILADAMGRLGQRSVALQYAVQGLSSVQRGQYQAGIPEALLAEWQAPTPEGLLLRQCLAYSGHSSYFARETSRQWLMAWAKLEPENPEPFLRFGLLFALIAAEEGRPVPAGAMDALNHAKRYAQDQRPELALALLQGSTKEMALPYDGTIIHVRPEIRSLCTFVLLEQGDWFEPELDLFRAFVRPGDKVLDWGAYLGVYALSAAQRVGEAGRAVALEANADALALLRRSATLHPQLLVQETLPPDSPERKSGCDVVKLSFDCRSEAARPENKAILEKAALVIYEVRDGKTVDTSLATSLKPLGFESFVYLGAQRALRHYDEGAGLDEAVINLVAVRLESLARLDGRARLL